MLQFNVLTDKFELYPGVPGGGRLVVHPAPVLPAVSRHHWLQVEGGLAGVRGLLVVDIASLPQHLGVLPVLASPGSRSQVKTEHRMNYFQLLRL